VSIARWNLKQAAGKARWTDEQEAHEADTWGEAANIAEARTDTEHGDIYATVISVKGVRITRNELWVPPRSKRA